MGVQGACKAGCVVGACPSIPICEATGVGRRQARPCTPKRGGGNRRQGLRVYAGSSNPRLLVARAPATLVRDAMQGAVRRIPISYIKRFQQGQETSVFKRYPQPQRALLSFSVFYADE